MNSSSWIAKKNVYPILLLTKYVKAQEIRNDFRNWENPSEKLMTPMRNMLTNMYYGSIKITREIILANIFFKMLQFVMTEISKVSEKGFLLWFYSLKTFLFQFQSIFLILNRFYIPIIMLFSVLIFLCYVVHVSFSLSTGLINFFLWCFRNRVKARNCTKWVIGQNE